MSLYERPWEPAVALGRRVAAVGTRSIRRQRVIERNWEVQHPDNCGPDHIPHLLYGTVLATAGKSAIAMQELGGSFLRVPDAAAGYSMDILLALIATTPVEQDLDFTDHRPSLPDVGLPT